MNNPPAFPLHNHGMQTLGLHVTGMTLRDYFAAKVMQGFAARDSHDAGLATPQQRAKRAYIDADTMLKARKNENSF